MGCEELLVSSCFSVHKRTIGRKRKNKNWMIVDFYVTCIKSEVMIFVLMLFVHCFQNKISRDWETSMKKYRSSGWLIHREALERYSTERRYMYKFKSEKKLSKVLFFYIFGFLPYFKYKRNFQMGRASLLPIKRSSTGHFSPEKENIASSRAIWALLRSIKNTISSKLDKVSLVSKG